MPATATRTNGSTLSRDRNSSRSRTAEAISGMRSVVDMLHQADESATEILAAARTEADRLVADATAEAAKVRAQADAYANKTRSGRRLSS